jgi:hypothetical protein
VQYTYPDDETVARFRSGLQEVAYAQAQVLTLGLWVALGRAPEQFADWWSARDPQEAVDELHEVVQTLARLADKTTREAAE